MIQAGTILLVDDDREVTAALAEYLEGRGHHVAVAHTGRDALVALGRDAPSLVLVDLLLPDVDGVTLMREAHRLDPAPEVVIVTGHGSLDSAIAAVEAGAAGYVEKPVDLPRLGALVARSLERRRLARENAELLAQLAERQREAEALHAISSTIVSTLDFQEALRRVCQEFARLLGADTASAYLHDRASDLLTPLGGYHGPKGQVAPLASASLPLREQGFHVPLSPDQRPIHSDDVAHDPRFSHELFRLVQHQSGLLVPLVLDDELAGAFYLVWWTERRRFTAEELRLIEQVASQVGLFLRNARLYERAGRDRRRLEALNEVSRHLAEVHDPDKILSLIVDEATRLLGAEAAGLRLVEGDELVVGARTESAEALMQRARLRLGESLSGIVVATGEPVVVEDMVEDTRYDPGHKRGALELGFHGFLGVPLRAHGRTVGTLNVYTRSRRRFLPDEISLLLAFADQASHALEKGRLLAEAQSGRRLLTDIFDSTSDGMMLVGLDGQIVSANHRAGELLGFDPTRTGGLGLTGLLAGHFSSGSDYYSTVAELKSLLDEPGRGGEGDLELPVTGRTLHWVGRPTRDASGTSALTLTFHDVTQEREVSRMKSDFVSFVTHQLRTPLAGIKWLLELVAGSPGVPEEPAAYVRDAREAAERLIGLVNDLLDISRLESGTLTIVPRETHLGGVTGSVLDEMRTLVEEKGHRLTVSGDDAVPTVMTDPQLLRQVVMNLVSNAIKYTRPGGEITIRMVRGDDGLVWAIRDSGIGIPKDAQRRLFEKFYRAENVLSIETEGTGLGLYLIKRIVERLGGRVWCESEEGSGATFSFTLPL